MSLGETDANSGLSFPVISRSNTSPVRYPLIDIWRALAIIGVVIYHFVWDLSFFGYAPSSAVFNTPMTVFARTLAGSFMFLVGVSLTIAHRDRIRWRKFFVRFAKLVVAAAVISVATYLMSPQNFIYFGILHAIAAASFFGLLFLRLPIPIVLLTAVLMLSAPFFFQTPIFDARILAWVGFADRPPMANDFVPAFPWFGVTLAGIGLTRWFLPHTRYTTVSAVPRPRHGLFRTGLVWIGQKTLPIYLIHQPVLFGFFFSIQYFGL